MAGSICYLNNRPQCRSLWGSDYSYGLPAVDRRLGGGSGADGASVIVTKLLDLLRAQRHLRDHEATVPEGQIFEEHEAAVEARRERLAQEKREAELAVTAQMLLIDDAPPRNHPMRRRWFANWTNLGNAPAEHGQAFAYLSARRGPARYADVKLKVRGAHLSKMLDIVEETIGHARARVGDPITTLR